MKALAAFSWYGHYGRQSLRPWLELEIGRVSMCADDLESVPRGILCPHREGYYGGSIAREVILAARPQRRLPGPHLIQPLVSRRAQHADGHSHGVEGRPRLVQEGDELGLERSRDARRVSCAPSFTAGHGGDSRSTAGHALGSTTSCVGHARRGQPTSPPRRRSPGAAPAHSSQVGRLHVPANARAHLVCSGARPQRLGRPRRGGILPRAHE